MQADSRGRFTCQIHVKNDRARAITAVQITNDSWPKLSSKIHLTPEKETGGSRQTEGTGRFRNIDPAKMAVLGLQDLGNHTTSPSFLLTGKCSA